MKAAGVAAEAAAGTRNDDIRSAVLDECLGYNGGEPHATGYRNDVPTLCDRCARLIDTLQRTLA